MVDPLPRSKNLSFSPLVPYFLCNPNKQTNKPSNKQIGIKHILLGGGHNKPYLEMEWNIWDKLNELWNNESLCSETEDTERIRLKLLGALHHSSSHCQQSPLLLMATLSCTNRQIHRAVWSIRRQKHTWPSHYGRLGCAWTSSEFPFLDGCQRFMITAQWILLQHR